jgi:hypothetical protein
LDISVLRRVFVVKNFLDSSSDLTYRNKTLFVLVSVTVVALMIDSSLVKIYSLSLNLWASNMSIIFFIAVGTVYLVGQVLLLQFVKVIMRKRRINEELHLKTIHKSVTIVQYGLSIILVFVILQILLTSRYSFITLSASTGISYGLAVILSGLLSLRFFSWFRSKRENVILLYGLSSLMIGINACFTVVLVNLVLAGLPSYAYPHPTLPYAPFIPPGSVADILNYLFVTTYVLSFVLSWSATVLLLRSHFRRFGKAKYWAILTLPLAYFLIQFLPLFPSLFAIFFRSESIFFMYTLFFTFSKPAGAIFFGFAFWMIARRLSRDSIVREYMIISGVGLVLLFISNEAIVFVDEPYPPFGLASVSFMGIASYLVLIGIYYSALSASQDVDLRQSIRTVATKLLESIAVAQMEQDVEMRVGRITKRIQATMIEESGIPSSLDDQDIKEYTQQVINEVRGSKERITTTTEEDNTEAHS